MIQDFLDFPGNRAAVHVAIEHAHKDRNARQGVVAEAKIRWRHRACDLADAAVCRRDHQSFTHRRDAWRIAEEIRAPERRQCAEPSKWAPQPEQDQADQREGPDEWVSLGRDRNELSADRIVDRHAPSYSAASAGASSGAVAAALISSSTGGGLRLGALFSSSPARASFSRASSASR